MEDEALFDENQEAPIVIKRGTWSALRLVLIIIISLTVGFGGGIAASGMGGVHSITSAIPLLNHGLDPTPDSSADLTQFWEVWNALDSQYVITHASSTMPSTQDKIYGAIQGMTAAYGDPYTVFFPPTQAKDFADNISGSFGGVGMELGENKDNVLVVIAALKGTPADKAGIQPGDEVIGINGKSTENVTSDAAVAIIRGPKGTTVTFTIVRAGKTLTVPVVRDTIQVPEIENGLDKKTGVYTIALYEFTQNSADLFNTAFQAFKASGSKDLVIDLRGNPGGYLDSAVAIASHFLPKGATIVTEDYRGKAQNIVHTSTGTLDVPPGTKVAILINAGSASASEILSGALKDNHIATLVGTQSFGKGSVQELIPVGSASLKVTVARWLTPAGINIMGNGITPDIFASTTDADITAHNDTQMQRAVQFLTTGK
jgi:carboxyl-terminal processing protease